MNRFDHFLVTRFNLKVAYACPETRLDPAWLEHRFELFDSFCYPSVIGQSVHNFKWLVFFDADTPDRFKAKVAEYSQWKNFVPEYIMADIEEYNDHMCRAVLSHSSDAAQFIVTTRLDNDDALGICFVETLHEILADKHDDEPECINFACGNVFDRLNCRLYLANTRSNQVISLIEKPYNLKTVYCVAHPDLCTVAPVREVMTVPLWLQVIHEKNAATSLYGVRVPVKGLTAFQISRTFSYRSDSLSCLIERGRLRTQSIAKALGRRFLPSAVIAILRSTQSSGQRPR
jgi:hypothetical protein